MGELVCYSVRGSQKKTNKTKGVDKEWTWKIVLLN